MTWLPFDLHPEYPPEGIPREALERRYGERLHGHVRELFESAGLAYNPPADVVPNSHAALRLTELARDHGLHGPLHDRLMEAYWANGDNIGDRGVLRAHAVDAGLDRDDVDRVLAGDDYGERVQASTREAYALGVTGVPAFLLDLKLLVLGAQPREIFEQAFAQLAR